VEGVSNEQLLAELRAICATHERAGELLDELASRLGEDDWVLPVEVISELRRLFPAAGKRTIEGVERRCKFAHRVWAEKYGPFSVDQGQYAVELMLFVIKESKGNYGFLYSGFDRIINHEDVDKGFKRRRDEEQTVKFDTMELL
jgi:hypothetical protein